MAAEILDNTHKAEEVPIEEPEQIEEEEEEEEEPEDQKPAIMEACSETKECAPAKHHWQECEERVANGSSETCVEEFFHYMHCVDTCAAPKLFSELK